MLRASTRDRRPGRDLPSAQRLRQVVPAQLQHRGGHLLPQHRPRSADRSQRLRPRTGAGVRRRRGRPRSCSLSMATAGPAALRRQSRLGYETTVGRTGASGFGEFHASPRDAGDGPELGTGSSSACTRPTCRYLPTTASPTTCRSHTDHRGGFVEMLKTPRLRPDLVLYGTSRASPAAITTTTPRWRSSCVIQGQGEVPLPADRSPGESHRVAHVWRRLPVIVETFPARPTPSTNIGDGEMIVPVLGQRDLRPRAARHHCLPAMKRRFHEETEGHDRRRHPAGDHPPVAGDGGASTSTLRSHVWSTPARTTTTN